MVLTVHDIGWESFPQIYPRALALRLSVQVRASARRAARIIASSQYTASDLVDIYGVPQEKIRVVYPPLSPEFAPVADRAAVDAALAAYGVRGPYILYVGSIEPKKNVHRLIDAFAELKAARGIPHTLVVAGRPLWLAEESLRRPAERGVQDAVRFIGPARQEHLAALYSGAEAFAFLGMYEGFGYPPLEALACGAPVLAARRTSLPEVLGDAALLADPEDPHEVADGLWRLLSDAGLRGALRERGQARARLFDVARHARQVAEVYAECAAEGRGARDELGYADKGELR
jgi:glycosyltransferase involved in cell wall biosynthesis